MEQQGKVCTKCGVWKSLDEFCKDKSKKDGRRSDCKECQKGYRAKNKEKRRLYSKE